MANCFIMKVNTTSSASENPRPEEICYHPGSIPFDCHASRQLNKERGKGGNDKHWLAQKFRRSNFERIFPIVEWLPQYNTKKAVSDLIAGLTVALTVLPQALAYSVVAGLPLNYGLYSSFIGPLVYIFIGGTKAVTIGPTAINSILTYKYTYGKSPEYAIFLTFVTGVACTFLAVFKLGFVANFISAPVISGFTSAVALTVVSTQVKALLGIKFKGEGFLPTVQGVIQHLHQTNPYDAFLSLACCSFIFLLQFLQPLMSCLGLKKFDKLFWLISTSRNALVMLFASIYAYSLQDPPFAIVRNIPQGIPSFTPPPFQIYEPADNTTHFLPDILKEQASALFVLPTLAIIGHITIAKAFAKTSRVDTTQEILCIGISNLIGSFFSNYPVGGSFSRTTVNAMSGVESPFGGIYTGLTVLLALQFLTPYFYYIPRASLASVISTCVIHTIEIRKPIRMWYSKRMDLIPLTLTFFVTLFGGLEHGIFTGLICSTLYLLYYSARPRVQINRGKTSMGNSFVLVKLDRSLTFPSVDYITHKITKAGLRYADAKIPLVIDCQHIQFADYTAGEGMRDLVLRLNMNGLKIIFWRIKPSILRILVGVMTGTSAWFMHCDTRKQMESLIDSLLSKETEDTIELNLDAHNSKG